MRSSSLLWVVGLAVTVGVLHAAGCSDETSSSTGSPTSSSQASAGSTTGMAGSTSGSMGSGGGSSSSTTGAGGESGVYTTCGQCTAGSPMKECATQKAACDKDADCTKINDCVFNTCATDKDGGCCALKCIADSGASQASGSLFKAYDNCVYCTTCKTLCTDPPSYDATSYCKSTSGMTTCP